MEARRIIGVDENGLGPRLGPLVVTGVRLRLAGAPPSMAELRAATGLDDSKRVFAPGRRGRGEALALGVLGVRTAASPVGLLAGRAAALPWAPPEACPLSAAGRIGGLGPGGAGAAPLPPRAAPSGLPPRAAPSGPPWEARCPALPVRALPRWTNEVRDVTAGLERLGVVVERVAWAVLCPGTLNVALADGTSKLAVDLRLFEVVVEALRADAGEGCETVCGKVGGTDRYGPRFAAWEGRVREVELESRARSTYEVAGVGRVSFVRDADAAEPAVATASVLGKYVRELWMDDLAAAAGWEGPVPSGYHDAASERLEARLRERIAAGALSLPIGCVRRLR
ncbi:MAG: hypothetical protein JXB32_00170 [Deltaproteobacteria bacterium]|nr:hypothetical protein [Deltaproteobacteria bacterium]